MHDVRARSLALTGHFITRWEQSSVLQSHAALVTPLDGAQRGSQVSLALETAFPVSQALIADGVIVDFREPNIVRLAFHRSTTHSAMPTRQSRRSKLYLPANATAYLSFKFDRRSHDG